MELLEKVNTRPFICAVELAFTAQAIPSTIEGWQVFINSTFSPNDFTKTYAGKSTLDFGEETQDSSAGTSYKQKAVFRFPVTDHQRGERIALLQKIKYLKFKLTNGLDIVIGRNDFYQNTAPQVKVKSNEHLCEVEITTQSIMPCGFTPNLNIYGLPTYVPVTLN